MPVHNAPGDYIEELSPSDRIIEGVNTSTAALIGLTRSGPVGMKPQLLSSYADYERVYDNPQDAAYDGNADSGLDILTHSVRAFYSEGGKQLYAARVVPTGVEPKLADWQTALGTLEQIEDISIIAAPGHTEFPATAAGFTRELVAHAEKRALNRIAVLDVPKGKTQAELSEFTSAIDSSYAAFYYPWVEVLAPGGSRLLLPPSGFICGIYARTDADRGVWKAPANESIRSITGLERMLTKSDQDALNRLRVNCLRFFQGRGYRVWGARTTSSEPEWKYVNIRRYCTYLERSIDRGTQWVVFEMNEEPLWAAIRAAVNQFLLREWRLGALQGERPEEAFFVQCDRRTMTQTDIDNGRLVCLVGVAPIRPAEFIIFRINQKTTDPTG